MSPLLPALATRTTPLTVEEQHQLLVALAREESPLRVDTYVDALQERGLLGDAYAGFVDQLTTYRGALNAHGLLGFTGYVGRTADGKEIPVQEFKFSGIDGQADGFHVYVSDRHVKRAEAILGSLPIFKREFAGVTTTLDKTIALAFVVADYETRALNKVFAKYPEPTPDPAITPFTEASRTDFIWEMLARIDYELAGRNPEDVIHSDLRRSQYNAIKGFIAASGLQPMSQRFLAVRDGRDRPVPIASGQGANYLADLNRLLSLNNAQVQELYNALKPLALKYGIDLDFYRTLERADQTQIENYLKINGVRFSMGMQAIVQVLWARLLENYGASFHEAIRIIAQSGGQPAAYYLAMSFEKPDYVVPEIPQGAGGYRTVEGIKKFVEHMLIEADVQQIGTEPAYAADVKTMEPLVANPAEPPSATDIAAYFERYRTVNMSLSGIAYDKADAEMIRKWLVGTKVEGRPRRNKLYCRTPLGILMAAINERYKADPNSYVFMSNLNTPDTPTGYRSYFILVGGRGQAMVDLAKMLILRDAAGYDREVVKIVTEEIPARSAEKPGSVRPPVTNTRVTLAPHDPVNLRWNLTEHLRRIREAGITVGKPRVPIPHNWTLEDVSQSDGTPDEVLVEQQYLVPVDLPGIVASALTAGATSVIELGAGNSQVSVYLPVNAQNAPFVKIGGVMGKDAAGVGELERLTTSNPALAFAAAPVTVAESKTVLEKLAEVEGVTVLAKAGDANVVEIRLDDTLTAVNFATFRELFLALNPTAPVMQLLTAETVRVAGADEPNLLRGLLRNQKGLVFKITDLTAVEIFEQEQLRFRLERADDGRLLVTEFNPTHNGNSELFRQYKDLGEGRFEHIALADFRRQTREVYAEDWNINLDSLGELNQPYTVTEEVTTERMVRFAGQALQSRDVRYTNPGHAEFGAHPHFLIDLGWRAMLAPTFSDQLDLDFTRVIDEQKDIALGVPIKAGDKITFEARIVRAEDFNDGRLKGRRIIVAATATNQKGEFVGRVVSSMVSRLAVDVVVGSEPHVIYRNDELAAAIDFFAGRPVHTLTPPQNAEGQVDKDAFKIAEGGLTLPKDLATTYGLIDPNRIHLSDLSAALAGFGQQGRIMQGLGSLAYVNERVIQHLQKAGLIRGVHGVSGLTFSGLVLPGDALTYHVKRVAHSNGDHKLEVVVKGAAGTVFKYNLVAQGPKTAVVFTGQGSQYEGMGDQLIADPARRAQLEALQAAIPAGADGQPVINLLAAMNAASKDTSQAQPMIMAYSYILFGELKAQGLIPDDAVFSGHSLGMWIALLAAGAMRGGVVTAMNSVYQRGAAMERYNDHANPQGMIAVMDSTGKAGPLDAAKLEILKKYINREAADGVLERKIGMANDNDPFQVILGGHLAALTEATPILKAWGYNVTRLEVANAFHTELMAKASRDFGDWMTENGSPFQVPAATLYMDIEGRPLSEVGDGSAAALADVMKRQIATGVQWRATIRRMLADGVRRFVEIGPARKGSANGTLISMIKNEATALGVLEEITVVFANPLLNQKNWSIVTFEATQNVAEFAWPTLVIPEAVAVPAPQPAESAQPATPVAPSLAAPQIVPVNDAQVAAVIEGFFTSHPVAEGADTQLLATELAAQLASLGAGARGPISVRLASLTAAGASSAGSQGASVLEQLLERYRPRKADVSKDADMEKDVGIGTAEITNEVAALNALFKVSVDATEDLPQGVAISVGMLAGIYEGAGAKGSSAGAAAPQLTGAQLIEKQALELAMAQLPQMPMGGAPAGPALVAVGPAAVEAAHSAYMQQHGEAIASGNIAGLVAGLAAAYQQLGPGAVGSLQARLALLAPAAGASGGAATVPSVLDQLLERYSPRKADVSKESDMEKDVGIGTAEITNEVAALNAMFKVSVDATEDLPQGVAISVGMIAGIYEGAGAASGTALATSSAVTALSPADELDKQAIAQVLPGLQAGAAAAAPLGQVVVQADPAIMQRLTAQLAALQARIEALEAGRGAPVAAGSEGIPVVLNAAGEVVDARDVEINALRTMLDNIRRGTSDNFVDNLMQPHGFDGSRIFSFTNIERLAGRFNLMQFIIDLRAGNLGKDQERRINKLANQLDEISLQWLSGRIDYEFRHGQNMRGVILMSLQDKAKRHIAADTIITGGVTTIHGVRYMPEYGSPHMVNPVARTESTGELAEEMLSVGDPRNVDELLWLLKEGVDLRGIRALVQQAGTMTAPIARKLAELGAAIDLTDRKGRSAMLESGQVNNDFMWEIASHGARGSQLSVLPHIQPGNPHDEAALIAYYDHLAGQFQNFKAPIGDTKPKNIFKAQVELINKLPNAGLGKILRARAAAINTARIADMQAKGKADSDLLIELTDAEKAVAIAMILPQLYLNGAAYHDYPGKFGSQGPGAGEGKPYDMLAILALSSRNVAHNLALLHKKYGTGKQVFFFNFYSPNSAIDLAAKLEEIKRVIEEEKWPKVAEILTDVVEADVLAKVRAVLLDDGLTADQRKTGLYSILSGSMSYPLAKAALAPGLVGIEAFANGLIWEDGRPILVEVSGKTGWGKSDGTKATIMSLNDFYTEFLEHLMSAAGVRLLTQTGDQLATSQLAGLLHAFKTGSHRAHVERNYARDFDAATRAGLLGPKMDEARAVELAKHNAAREAWQAAHAKAEDPSTVPNDGSLVDPNNLNISIVGAGTGQRYAAKADDIIFGDDTMVVTGYGMVGPLGPDALTNYRGMLANGHFKGHEGFGWLGEYDFYNIARSVGVDVSKWNYRSMAEATGLAKAKGGWEKTFKDWLLKNQGFQQIGEFVEFEVLREVSFATDTIIPLADASQLQKMQDYGYDLRQQADGSFYAIARAGQKYQLPMKYRLPATVMATLPGHDSFDFKRFGITKPLDHNSEAHAAMMAKMFTAQILMSMGGYSPEDLHREFGAENIQVAIGTGLGDLKPFNAMTVGGILKDHVPNYLMAALLPDATTGQVATEMLGAKGMALAVIAACSTGNANIVMAMKAQFGQYYLAAKRLAELKDQGQLDAYLRSLTDPRERTAALEAANTDWADVFKQLLIAGGVDYAITFNAIFGFEGLGAIIQDDWIKARDLFIQHISRPDDPERSGFVIGTGGGAQALETLAKARQRGAPVYGMVLSGAFRTDGYKSSREGYGWGQRGALFEAWRNARDKLTTYRYTESDAGARLVMHLGGARALNQDVQMGSLATKRSVQTALLRGIKTDFGLDLRWQDIKDLTLRETIRRLREESRTLRKNVKIVVMGHKTSTGAGDPYEEESLRMFLSTILPEGEFAHLIKTKAHIGHLLGGSSGADAALTPLVFRYLGVPGVPGLDNLDEHAATNAHVFHHKDAVDMRGLYDEDTTYVVIREAAGFNAKNTAIVEAYGKVSMKDEAEATTYAKNLVENYARERLQKRAERLGLRTMAFDANKFPDVPASQFRDLFELSIRSEAIGQALIKEGRTFDLKGTVLEYFKRVTGDRSLTLATSLRRMNMKAHDFGNIVDALNEKFSTTVARADFAQRDHRSITIADVVKAYTDRGVVYDGFSSKNILDWIYEFKVNDGVVIDIDEARMNGLVQKNAMHLQNAEKNPALTPAERREFEALRNAYTAIKYREAQERLAEIVTENLTDGITRKMGETARANGWDEQVMVFYGVSDGMGLRSLLALIASGTVKEVVAVHLDAAPYNDKDTITGRSSSYNPEALRAFAAKHGVHLQLFNDNGIYYDFKTGAKLDLQSHIESAVEKARVRSGIKDVNVGYSVAFGRPYRRPADKNNPFFVPHIDEYGRLKHMLVPTFETEDEQQRLTINTMGHAFPHLLDLFNRRGWLGPKSHTFSYDWWGSESEDVLAGVYGGAALGDAKNFQKAGIRAFAEANPNSGKHLYAGFPAFLSAALNAISGGTLTGLITKRLYEDLASGVLDASQFAAPENWELRFYSMEELAKLAMSKLVHGEFTGPHGNKVAVDMHEQAVAKEIDRRFKEIGRRVKAALDAKKEAYFAANPQGTEEIFYKMTTLSPEESFAVISDLVPADYLTYTYEHIESAAEQHRLERMARQNREGIELVALPEVLQTTYPFFQRAISDDINTPALAIQVIDAGGVGTLFGSTKDAATIAAEVAAVHAAVGETAPLVGNVMMSSANLAEQVDAYIASGVTAISFGNGYVSRELVLKVHAAGVLVIQLVGSASVLDELAAKGVDLLIAERNIGPGHVLVGEADQETLIKRVRQASYEHGIPVVAGGGYATAADVADALHWGASAVQLDDPISFALESSNAAKGLVIDATTPVVLLHDAEGKTIRALNTQGAQKLMADIARFEAIGGAPALLKPIVASLIQKAFEAAAGGDTANGLFLASQNIAAVTVNAPLEVTFKKLLGKEDPETTPEDPNDGPKGGGGGKGGGGRVHTRVPREARDWFPDAELLPSPPVGEGQGEGVAGMGGAKASARLTVVGRQPTDGVHGVGSNIGGIDCTGGVLAGGVTYVTKGGAVRVVHEEPLVAEPAVVVNPLRLVDSRPSTVDSELPEAAHTDVEVEDDASSLTSDAPLGMGHPLVGGTHSIARSQAVRLFVVK